MQDKNVEALCKLYSCKPEAFADWIDNPIRRAHVARQIQDDPGRVRELREQISRAVLDRKAREIRRPLVEATAVERAGERRDDIEAAVPASKSKKGAALPRLGKLSENAKQERMLGLDCQTVIAPSGTYPLLGFNRFKLIWSRPKAHDGQRFAVQGKPDDYMGLNQSTAEALGTDDGGKFRVSRMVSEGLPFYATVFAASGEHFEALNAQLDRGLVTIIVRVLHKPPKGKFRGFFFYEDREEGDSRKPTPRVPKDFAFVVEEIHPATEESCAA
jgi:hypothetical protein